VDLSLLVAVSKLLASLKTSRSRSSASHFSKKIKQSRTVNVFLFFFSKMKTTCLNFLIQLNWRDQLPYLWV
jgi:hypothetical protein